MYRLENNLRRVAPFGLVILLVLSLLVSFASECVHGQAYGSGTGYCVDGSCVPNPANFGYYQTGWRRWPTSRPTSLHGEPVESQPIESLPEVDLPDPNAEGEVNPRFRPNPQPELPRQPEAPELPPFNLPVDPSPTLPPLDIPQPSEEDQGSNWSYGHESIVARPVELAPLQQVRGGDFLVAASKGVAAKDTAQPQRVVHEVAQTPSRRKLVQTVSWDNPLREGEVASAQSHPEVPSIAVTDDQREDDTQGDVVGTLDAVTQRAPREPARIDLPQNVTPLPPPETFRELGSESDFVHRQNPIRSTTRVSPTAFHGEVDVNPLRTSTGSPKGNPLRSQSDGLGPINNATPNVQPLRNPLRGGG